MRCGVYSDNYLLSHKILKAFLQELRTDGIEIVLFTNEKARQEAGQHIVPVLFQELDSSQYHLDVILNLSDEDNPNSWFLPRYGSWMIDLFNICSLTDNAAIVKNYLSGSRFLNVELIARLQDNDLIQVENIQIPVDLKYQIGFPGLLDIVQVCLPYIRKCLLLLQKYGDRFLEQRPRHDLLTKAGTLSALDKLQFSWGYQWNKYIASLFYYHWNVGVFKENLITNPSHRPLAISWIQHDNFHHSYADPFLWEYHDKVYVFMEDIELKDYRGKISVSEYSGEGLSRPRTIISREFSLSFPSLFEYNGQIFCLPDAHGSGKTIVFQAKDFPYSWDSEQDLMVDINAVDPQVIFHEGLYWLFLTRFDFGRRHQLFLYYAKNPLGMWKPHRLNPVKSDIRSARNAGQIIKTGDKMYRPSMDNTVSYGKKVVINEIMTLNTEDFEETALVVFDSRMFSSNTSKIHTASVLENIMAIDLARKRISLFHPSFIKRKLKRQKLLTCRLHRK